MVGSSGDGAPDGGFAAFGVVDLVADFGVHLGGVGPGVVVGFWVGEGEEFGGAVLVAVAAEDVFDVEV